MADMMLTGLAATREVWRTRKGSRVRFAPGAFDAVLSRTKGGETIPVNVDHRPKDWLRTRRTRLKETAEGLTFATTLICDHEGTQDAATAIAYGWFRQMSLSIRAVDSRIEEDRDGFFILLTDVHIDHVSLVKAGRVPGTTVAPLIGSQSVSKSPTWPKSDRDARKLFAYLSAVDYPVRIRDTPDYARAVQKIEANQRALDAYNYHKLVASGGVVTLDPISGETVRPSAYVIHGLPLLGSRSTCLV